MQTARLAAPAAQVHERRRARLRHVSAGGKRQFRGYTATYPGTTSLLGYAYPATDTDGDGLPDGFEYVVGTDHTDNDSDGDLAMDAKELPMVGVPVGDPCSGTIGAQNCPGERLFADGFEA